MSFHVVLPSNSSMQLYPSNSLADFRIRLTKPILLEKQYEVALEELVYHQIQHSFAANEVYMDVLGKQRDGAKSKSFERIRIQYSSEAGLKTLLWCINSHLEKFHWMLVFNKKGYFKFVNTSEHIVYRVLLHPKLAFAFGFVREPYVKLLRNHEEKSFHPCRLFSRQTQMFVYADIVDHQHVGDAMAPLLRICLANDNLTGSHSERYIRPYYVPVSRTRIDEIHIQVRTHTGDLFPFPSGAPLICKLHFQPKSTP